MRDPRPDEVLEAVAHVTGIDPKTPGRAREIIRSRRLACTALAQLCEMGSSSIARIMGYKDHTTAAVHLRAPVDAAALRAVVQRCSDRVELDELAERRRLARARAEAM